MTGKWAEEDISPTGQALLNAPKPELTKLLFSNDAIKRLEPHLKVARQALKENNNLPAAAGAAGTPLVDGPSAQEVDLSAGPSGPKPRARGRPSKSSRQSRLSQRLEVASQAADDDDDEEPAAAGEEDDDESSDYDEEEGDGAPARRTRRRGAGSRLAAVQRAANDIQKVQDELDLGDAMDEDDAAPSDSESDGEVLPTRRGGRAAPSARNAAAAAAAAVRAQQAAIDANRPEEPDDGVHPRNKDLWEDSVREGLVEILKLLPVDTLRTIVDEEIMENPLQYYKFRKKIDGDYQIRQRPKAFVAQKIVKKTLDGHLKPGKAEDGGTTWEGVDELLEKYVPEDIVKKYVDDVLKKRVATPPKISDTRQCLWRLWSTPIAKDGPEMATLGQITFPVVRIGTYLSEHWYDVTEVWDNHEVEPYLTTDKLNAAFKKQDAKIQEYESNLLGRENSTSASNYVSTAGLGGVKPDPDGAGASGSRGQATANPPQPEIVFGKQGEDDPHDWEDLFEQLLNMQGRMNVSIRWRLDIPNMKVKGEVVVDLKSTKGDVLVQAAFLRKHEDGGHELVQIWLDKILQAMDHLQGSDLLENDLEALNSSWDDAINDLEPKGVELTLEPPVAVDIKIFDQIMAGVENLERPMEAGVDAKCRDKIALKLKPYQKRALSFLLREEQAPGGTSRHLWLKVPLPGNQPGVECYMSPSLFQLYISKSPTATGIAIGNTGGGGWQALEMGMGKTAVIIAGILFNPVPAGWRGARPWKPYDSSDYMLTKTENMPRGGTLVVVPTTLVRQWENEIRKTLKNPEELDILRWTEAGRTHDCNEIARCDIVITTPQQVTKDATLASIYWHRVVVDEAQLNAASLMQSGILISTHRWIVSGTPCNNHPESLRPSLEFLRLGGYSDAQRHLPPALATVMRAVMCRYTLDGTIEGEKNLQLKALVEKTFACDLEAIDAEDEKHIGREAYKFFESTMLKAMRKAGCPVDTTMESYLNNPESLNALVKSTKLNYQAVKKQMLTVRSVVAGGTEVLVPGEFEFNARTGEDEPATRFFQSKAIHIVTRIEQVREEDPTAKCLVFSEYEETLKSIADLLEAVGLGHRAIYGSTSAKKRGEAIDLFMTDPPTKVFLLAARSAAVGVTLTAANHVFICEPQMNPAVEAQAIGRSQRMGQEKVVTVHRIFARNTIEERVRQLVARKHGGPGAAMASTAMAANTGTGEVQCNLADLHTLLNGNYEESDDEEEEEEDIMLE